MCGIFGIISKPGLFSKNQVGRAVEQLNHRGPDATGIEQFMINDWEIWLGHKRLSIIDLSPRGHQPMMGKGFNGTEGWIVYNGETYNFEELKKRLVKSWEFKSDTDTEVVLAGLLLKGPDYLKLINGMLALGLLNIREQRLLLARDRIGKKPLYIYYRDDLLVFASELKAIRSLGVHLSINNEALAYYRWLGYIPATMTIYNECSKLPAGQYALVDLKLKHLKPVQALQYWDPIQAYSNRFKGSYEDAIDELLCLLDDATAIRLIADVPVGIFLSGGIDSSLVASCVQKTQPGFANAISVKFGDPKFDESIIAKDTARKLGIKIKVLNFKSTDFDRQIKKIAFHYDEPFSDSSQIPTLAVAETAKSIVSVVLTGDGGDEVFLGYPRYSYPYKLYRINRLINFIPCLHQIISSTLKTSFGKLGLKYLLRLHGSNATKIESSINRIESILHDQSFMKIYDAIMSVRQKSSLSLSDQLIIGEKTLFNLVRSWYPTYEWNALAERTMEEQYAAIDLVSFMRDDVLVKVDRGTMAYSLEARSPLLDYRIIEFGASLPINFKLFKGTTKLILRDALSMRLAGDIKSLNKSGFEVPLPKDLPHGPDPQARWNIFVEEQWRQSIGESAIQM